MPFNIAERRPPMPRAAFVLALACAGCAPAPAMRTPPKQVIAELDPDASPPRLPSPNDRLRDPSTGLLLVSDPPGATPAQIEIHRYLRTLDGFLPATVATARFDGPIDPESVRHSNAQVDGSVAVLDVTIAQPLTGDDVELVVADDRRSIAIVPHLPKDGRPASEPWRLGHTYLVLLFGGAGGLRAAAPDTEVVAAPAMATERQRLSAAIDRLLPSAAPSRTRDDVVLAWTFSIAHGPFVALDLSSGRVPMPNDVFLDATTERVNLPFDPNAPTAPLYRALDQLDGFSTTASATVPIDVADDNGAAAPTGATPDVSAFLVNASAPALAPTFSAAPERANGDWDGLLALTPTRPLLPDRTTYIGVLTRDVKDARGRPLRPSLPMQLLLLESPLADDHGASTIPDLVDDATAARLEALRADLARRGVWQQLEAPPRRLTRDRIAAVWTFRTQSMTRTLADLAAWPAAKSLPVEVRLRDAADPAGALGPDVGLVVHGTLRSHLALTGGGAPGATLDLAGGRDVDVPFLFIAPAQGQARGVAIVQHGFGRWRGDLRPLAEAAAKSGWAIIGIDGLFHGARAACTKSGDCESNGTCRADGTCSTALAIRCTADDQCNGACTAGRCAGGLAPDSTLCMTHTEQGAAVLECNPAASGAAALLLANPFAVRDALRQHVLDLAQLARVVQADGPGTLRAQLAALPRGVLVDNTRVGYIGQALGGMTGALFLAAGPKPLPAALNVPGARLVDLFARSDAFAPSLKAQLAAWATPPSSPASLRVLDALRCALDPADPINVARPIALDPTKRVLVQEAGRDRVIPNDLTDALATELGLPFLDGHPAVNAAPAAMPQASARPIGTFFPAAAHGFLFTVEPSTEAGQAQAMSFLDSGGLAVSPAN